jgi:hypothetical protein
VASIFFLTILVTIPTCSVAFRSDVFKVEAEGMPGSLRGRRKVHDGPRAARRESQSGRRISSTSDESDLPDLSVLGMIENRRYSAMEAMLHTDEMMVALRFSASMSMVLVRVIQKHPNSSYCFEV